MTLIPLYQPSKREQRRENDFPFSQWQRGAISKEDTALSKKEYKEKLKKNNPYPSISYKIGAEIQERTGQEIRITVPGHTQRGGSPCAYDRVISSRLGAAAADLILKEKYGYMVGFKGNGDRSQCCSE